MSPPYMIYSAVAECDYSVLANVRCFERRVSIVTVFWKGEEIDEISPLPSVGRNDK